MGYVNKMLERIQHVKKVDVLTDEELWGNHDHIIWEANSLESMPHFYPLYQYKNYYSFSVFALILKKNRFVFNNKASEATQLSIIPNNMTIDSEIMRVGGPYKPTFKIQSPEDYASLISEALIADIKNIEQKNRNHVNFIMCGGKDSLNLLLLPWQNETVALSAEPNFSLVEKFINDNNLNISLIKLEDDFDESIYVDEVLECACRSDLSHWRWTVHLRELVAERNNKVVIWKGQLGDLFLSDTWKAYCYQAWPSTVLLLKFYKRLSKYLPLFLNKILGRPIQQRAIQTSWCKAATMQGAHVGYIRALCDCLVLSAYHGKHVQRVIQQVDLATAVQSDIRDDIGFKLLGRAIKYPTSNPGPAPSTFREGLHSADTFKARIHAALRPKAESAK